MVARHIGDVWSFLLDRLILSRYCFEHVVLFAYPTVQGVSRAQRVTSPKVYRSITARKAECHWYRRELEQTKARR